MNTAQEMRQLAEKSQKEVNIDHIIAKIKDSAAKGYFAVQFSGQLHDFELRKLKELGYTYKYDYDQREGDSWTTISW